MRILVLLMVEPSPCMSARGVNVKEAYQGLLNWSEGEIIFASQYEVLGLDLLRSLDLLVISGSPESVNSPAGKKLVDHLEYVVSNVSSKTKIIGVCFGFQALSVISGGQVKKISDGWNIGLHNIKTLKPKEWMNPSHSGLRAIFNHREYVSYEPRGTERLMEDESGRSAMALIKPNWLGVQFHPEYSPNYQKSLLACFPRIAAQIDYQAVIDSYSKCDQNGIFRKWIEMYTKN